MPKSSNSRLYFSACVACLTASLFGYSVGFIGGVLVLPSFLRSFNLNDLPANDIASVESRIVTVWLVGALFGVPLGMPVCSRLGRKSCLLFSALLYVLGAAMELASPKGRLGVFEAGRFLNGVGVGAGTLASPIYISEISPPSERGMLMSGYQAFLQTSALIGFWGAFASNAAFPLTSPLQWQIPVAIQLLPGIFLLTCTLLIPESPSSLIERGKLLAAEKALAWIRALPVGNSDLTHELRELEETATTNKASHLDDQPFLHEAVRPEIRRRLLVGIGLMIAQNMVGLNALNYYAPVIFMSAGFTSVSSSLFLTGVFGLVKVVSAVAFMFVFVRMRGNRFWLKLGSAVCGITMLILAYYVRVMPPPDQTHDATLTIGGVVSVLMVYVFAFSFGVSLGPISWNVCSEIFPSHINATCCSITTCTQWLFQIVIAAITPHLLASVGWATYLIYAFFCAISFTWVSACVPETRGVALGKPMDELFDENLKGAVAIEEVEEVTETTALLRHQRRRSSVVIPV